jgi:ribosomal protein S2
LCCGFENVPGTNRPEIVTEPEADLQAVKEATIVHVPVVALVSTNNSLRNVDLAIPINNKGRKSLALAFWTLSKELLIARGDIKNEAAMEATTEDFEYKVAPTQGGEEDPVKQAIMEGRQLRRKRFGNKPRPAPRFPRFG